VIMILDFSNIVSFHVLAWVAASLLVVSLHSLFVAVSWFTALKVTKHSLLKILLSLMPKKTVNYWLINLKAQ